jgi:hypothetical protein
MGITLDRLEEIKIVDNDGDVLAIDSSGFITANIDGTVTVDGTVAATQSGTWDINSIVNPVTIQDGGGSITVDGIVTANFTSEADDAAAVTNPLGVGGVAADVATALSEISAAGDRFHLLGTMYRQLITADFAGVGFQHASVDVGTTAVQLDTSAYNGRTKVIIQNRGNQSIFVGSSNSVTTGNGIEISKRSSMEFPFGEALELWAISGNAGQDVRILEAA